MKKLVKIGTLLMMSVAFAGAMSSCDDEYPKPGETPTIVETHNISGMVISRSGEGLEGVVLALNTGETVTTAANGYFVFPDVKIGEYTITAAKEGYIAADTKVLISNEDDGMNAVWNVMLLAEEAKKDITVSTTTATKIDDAMETGNITGNDNGNVEVSVEVPADAFEGATGNNIVISIMPIYDEDQAISRTEDGEIMLVGATLTCSDPNVELREGQTIALTFDLEDAAAYVDARKYNGDKFVAYDKVEGTSRAGGLVTILADKLNTTYGLFAPVTFNRTTATTSLTFNPAEVNNLNGNKGVQIGDCAYKFGVGTNIDVNKGTNNKLIALLIEAIATRYGSNATIVDAKYPVNITLPIGSVFHITGSQDIFNITATSAGMTATAKSYGNVKIDTEITNRADHNGSSSF